MKKFLPVFLAFLICFSSCSKSKSSSDVNSSSGFIQEIFSARKVEWTAELENSSESGKKNVSPRLPEKIRLNAVSYGVFVANNKDSLYPYIEGFASLDLTALNTEAEEVLKGFCKAFCASESLDSFMAEKSISELVFFKSDTDALFSSAEKEKADSESSTESAENEGFTYIYGKPFVTDDTFEVPVCFISKKGRLTVYLYLDKKSDWKIEQIQIKKWQVS